MTAARAGAAGLLMLAGLAASVAPERGQLAFAGLGIAGLGLPHGASDLHLVAPSRRAGFVAAYLLVAGLVTLGWLVAPAGALAALLALSAAHFALDRPAEADPAAGWALAGLLVAGPALLHRHALAALFGMLTGSTAFADGLTNGLAAVGAGALATLVLGWIGRRSMPEPATLAGVAFLVLLPPLVGFTLGFILLHAWPQLDERRHELGCGSLWTYLRRTAPVLAGALALVAGLAALFRAAPAGSSALLFAAIAALATPHMLVTPLWRAVRPATAPIRAARA